MSGGPQNGSTPRSIDSKKTALVDAMVQTAVAWAAVRPELSQHALVAAYALIALQLRWIDHSALLDGISCVESRIGAAAAKDLSAIANDTYIGRPDFGETEVVLVVSVSRRALSKPPPTPYPLPLSDSKEHG